jgi:hypothetical protein
VGKNILTGCLYATRIFSSDSQSMIIVNNVSDRGNRRRRGYVQSRVKACGRISIDMETQGSREEEAVLTYHWTRSGEQRHRPVILLVSGGQWK